MAKNLKLNVKNTQLAEALKLSKPKKPRAKKEEQPEEAPPVEMAVQKKVVTEEPQEKPSLEKTSKPPVSSEEKASPLNPGGPAKSFTQEGIRSSFKPAFKPAPREDSRSGEPRSKRMLEGFVKRDPSSFKPGYRPKPSLELGKKREFPRDSSKETNKEGSFDRSRPFPPRREHPPGEFRPGLRRPAAPPPPPPILPKEGGKSMVVHKKTSAHTGIEKDPKTQKKGSQDRSFDARDRHGLREGSDEQWRKRRTIKTKQQSQEDVLRPKELTIRLPITVKDLAAEMKLKASQLISKLFMQGVVITLNDYLDDETTVQLIGHDFECTITVDTKEEERIRITDKTVKEEILGQDEQNLSSRPPVVAFMGHVDHGKTSLIDAIRKSNRVAGEAGAITQHIGAFKCHTKAGDVTILDTPGHEAFSAMRERGASVTDIVVLVVAGDDGIKAQTLEAIEQAKEAKVPMVVAINKCDKESFDAEVVYRQLAERDLLPEAWGGSVITVNCSATTGEGIDNLLEMLSLQSEILELKANSSMRARGSVIESEMHKGLGAVATILVQNGTLRLGDALVFDHLYAKVKTMHDEYGKEMTSAGPSTPVKITGLSGLPLAGSEFISVKSEKEAREIADKRIEGHKVSLLQQTKKTSMEAFLQDKTTAQEKKVLNLILKADVQGSLEALKTSLRKLPSQKVELNFILEGVGEISESDIQYAVTSKATILGFHTRIEGHAESLIKQTQTTIRLHDIIYHAVDDVRDIMLSLLDKIPEEKDLGKAIVKAVFKSSQLGNIAGCQVTEGMIRRNAYAKVVREKQTIWKGAIASLKRVKEDVREVAKGLECGIVLQGFDALKEEDTIECFEVVYKQQELT